jgi:hypothetical protein
MLAIEKWIWIRRFATRLMELRPVLWEPTATAMACMAFDELCDLEPEEAAAIAANRLDTNKLPR